MALVKPYHRFRGTASFTAASLLHAAAEQLPRIAPSQTRYRVDTLPTPRSLRFYVARGLVDKPIGREGTRARYGYRHLLQILAVKSLQSQYLPLVKIALIIRGMSNRDLEQLLPETGAPAMRPVLRDRPELAGSETAAADVARPVPAPAPEGEGADTWHRIEVSPGIELHVHAAALPLDGRERLRGALLREMTRLRGWA